jgi:hypothetical protein
MEGFSRQFESRLELCRCPERRGECQPPSIENIGKANRNKRAVADYTLMKRRREGCTESGKSTP